jgi:hypothetical protein
VPPDANINVVPLMSKNCPKLTAKSEVIPADPIRVLVSVGRQSGSYRTVAQSGNAVSGHSYGWLVTRPLEPQRTARACATVDSGLEYNEFFVATLQLQKSRDRQT